MESEITEYQKQKFRDLSVLVQQKITNQKDTSLQELLFTVKQAIPYSITPLIATNYANSIDPLKQEIFETWVDTTTPSHIENLVFYIVVCLHDLHKSNLKEYKTAVEDWYKLNDLLLTYLDGEEWTEHLSDIDKLRELTTTLHHSNIKKFYNIETIELDFLLNGETTLRLQDQIKLDILYNVYTTATKKFEVPALTQFWFTTPDELTNATPLEYIMESPDEAETILITKLKTGFIQEN